MSEQNNVNGLSAGMAVAGGAAGGYLGYKNAPSVLGKVDVDAVLQHKITTDIVRDKILRGMGEASKDRFVTYSNDWFGIKHAIPNDVECFFNNINPKAEEVTVKQLKDAIAEGKVRSCKANFVEQLGNYKKAFETMADDVKLTREGLGNILRDNHSFYKVAKIGLQELVDNAPKLKGRYALICGGIGLVAAALLGTVISAVTGNKKAA